jgi:2-(1,2-epoxy-1,2-dihydrophenyl)acetyl-CoA isomerase
VSQEVGSADGALTAQRDGAILRLTLARPARRNSLSHSMVHALVDALTTAATDDALRAIHIRGEGDDFCSGADWVATNSGGQRPRTGDLVRRIPHTSHRLVELVATIHLPVVCTVRGWAVGLGCNLALAADFAVAADDAVFWEPPAASVLIPARRGCCRGWWVWHARSGCCCSARRSGHRMPRNGG